MNNLLLGYDFGTTGVKAGVFNVQGVCLDSSYVQYPTFYGEGGQVEQKPLDWLLAMETAINKILNSNIVNPKKIVALSVSAQMLGQIPIDKNGNLILERVPIWIDSRAKKEKEQLFERLGGYEKFYSITKQGMEPQLYSIFKIMWMKTHLAEKFFQIDKFLHTKDYIGYYLTGNIATDYSDQATGGVLDVSKLQYSKEILEAAEISLNLFPELHYSHEKLGYLQEGASKILGLTQGIPIFIGSGDAPASAAGALAINPGDFYFYIGSAAWGGTIEKEPVYDFDMKISVLPHIVPNLYHSQVVINTGAIAQQWAMENFYNEGSLSKLNYQKAIDEASLINPKENDVIFLPFLRKGGAPFYNMDARGTFFGLSIEHTRAHMYLSVLEGLVFSLKYIVDKFESYKKISLEEVTIIGGGARNDLLMQLFANITGKRVLTTKLKQDGNCFAAAINAGVGIGLLKSFNDIDKETLVDKKLNPNNQFYDYYSKKYKTYLDVYNQSLPIFERMKML